MANEIDTERIAEKVSLAATKTDKALNNTYKQISVLLTVFENIISSVGNFQNGISGLNVTLTESVKVSNQTAQYISGIANSADQAADSVNEVNSRMTSSDVKEYTISLSNVDNQLKNVAKSEKSASETIKERAKSENDAIKMTDAAVDAFGEIISISGVSSTHISSLTKGIKDLMHSVMEGASAGSVVGAGISLAMALITTGIEAVKKAEEKRKKVFEESVSSLKKYTTEIQALEHYLNTVKNTESTTEQLVNAKEKLISKLDNVTVGYTLEGEAILANNEALKREIELLKQKANYERQQVVANSGNLSVSDYQLNKLYLWAAYESYEDDIKKYNSFSIDNAFYKITGHDISPDSYIENLEEGIEKFEKGLKALLELNLEIRDSNGELIKTWDDLNNSELAVANTLNNIALVKLENGTFNSLDEAQAYLNTMMSNKEFVNQYYQELETQTQKQAEAVNALKTAYDDLNTAISSSVSEISGCRSKMSAAYAELTENGKLSQSTVNSLISSYPQLIDYLDSETGQLNLTKETMQNLYEIQKQLQIAELEGAKAKLEQNEAKIKSNYKLAESELLAAQSALMTSGTSEWKINDYYKKSSAFEDAKKELEEMQVSYNRIDTLISTINNTQLDLTLEGNGMKNAAKSASEYSQALEKLNHQKRMGQLSTKEEITALEQLGKKYTLTADEQIDLEYRIYSAKKQYAEEIESARAKALQEQYTQMENLKALGRLNAEQELEWLEKIRRTYKLNAEERIALEIKIYNLKEELRQNEVSALDDLGAAVTEALKNQYEEQRKAERDRINESIEAWEQWEKSTVESIQAEIDALDALEKEQESQSAAAEYYRKSQELKLQIAYEKDDYQRKQLEKELNRLTEEEEERLRKEQLEKQREELQNQIDEARNTAEERKKALEEELEVIDENYDKLTSALALRAQAEQIIMQQSQEKIITLIKSYAPEYGLAGSSVGESLYEAFKSKVDNIYSYIEEVMAAISQYQENAKAAAVKAANDFEQSFHNSARSSQSPNSVSVYYTSNFNTPVQSPVQTKRAIESTASNIAAMIR